MKSNFPKELESILSPIKLNGLGIFFVSFLIPFIAHKQFAANGWQMGILFSLQAVGTGCSSLIFAKEINLWRNRSKLIFLGSQLKMAAYILLFTSIIMTNFTLIVLAAFLLGFGSGLFWLVWKTTLAQKCPFEHRAEAFGIASKSNGAGIMWGSIFAFSLLSYAENRSLSADITYASLLVFAGASALAGFKSYKAIQSVKEKADVAAEVSPQKIEFTTFIIYLFAMIFVGQLVGSLVAPFLEVYLLENLNITSISDLSIAYIPGGVLSMLFAPRLGRYADKVNSALFLGVAGVIGAGVTLAMLMATSIWHISVLFVVDASVITASGLVLAKLVSEAAGESKGTSFGIQGFVTNMGSIAGPLIGGAFWALQGSRGPIIFSIFVEGVMALSCFVILLPLLKKSKKLIEVEV